MKFLNKCENEGVEVPEKVRKPTELPYHLPPVDFVNYLHRTRCDKVTRGPFTCMVPRNGLGIHETKCGYKSVPTKFNDEWKYYKTHILVCKTLKNKNNESMKGLHVSHLCANQGCCNPDHLELETPQKNNQRKGCIGYTLFEGRLLCACPHDPKCKIFTPDALEEVEQPPSDMDWFMEKVSESVSTMCKKMGSWMSNNDEDSK